MRVSAWKVLRIERSGGAIRRWSITRTYGTETSYDAEVVVPRVGAGPLTAWASLEVAVRYAERYPQIDRELWRVEGERWEPTGSEPLVDGESAVAWGVPDIRTGTREVLLLRWLRPEEAEALVCLSSLRLIERVLVIPFGHWDR